MTLLELCNNNNALISSKKNSNKLTGYFLTFLMALKPNLALEDEIYNAEKESRWFFYKRNLLTPRENRMEV